jgi:membrane associated rhomboid family serine protease
MLVPAPRDAARGLRRPTATLVLVLACVLSFGWVLAVQSELRPAVDAAAQRLEAAITAAPEARLHPQELDGLPDRWRQELASFTDAQGPADPNLSAAAAELRARVHALPTWRLGWIPSMASAHGWLSYLFVHTQWFHLVVNLLLLWFLGSTLECRSSSKLLVVIFLISGATGAWVHGALSPTSTVPLLGASASVAGVLGGLVASGAPWVLTFLFVGKRRAGQESPVIRIPLVAILLSWIGLEWLAFLEAGAAPSALPAHLSGCISGALVTVVWRRSRPRSTQGP